MFKFFQYFMEFFGFHKCSTRLGAVILYNMPVERLSGAQSQVGKGMIKRIGSHIDKFGIVFVDIMSPQLFYIPWQACVIYIHRASKSAQEGRAALLFLANPPFNSARRYRPQKVQSPKMNWLTAD